MRDNKGMIQSLSHNQLAKFLEDFANSDYATICGEEQDKEERINKLKTWLHQLEKPKEPNTVKMEVEVTFQTDGDFCFVDTEKIFDPTSTFYKGAELKYNVVTDCEYYNFTLIAEGPEDRCYYAVRDLLEHLICNMQTFKYYLIRDLYQLIIQAKEQCLWTNKETLDYSDSLGGNYEGTSIFIRMVRSE